MYYIVRTFIVLFYRCCSIIVFCSSPPSCSNPGSVLGITALQVPKVYANGWFSLPISVAIWELHSLVFFTLRSISLELNSDGSFSDEGYAGSFSGEGYAGAGMVLRDNNGNIIFSSCRVLFSCRDALEAELCASVEGLSFSLQISNRPIFIEMDSIVAVNLVQSKEVDRSVFFHSY